jgi:WD40 repeat protein
MGNCLQIFVGHTDMVLSVNFSPDGKQIVSTSRYNNLKLWDLIRDNLFAIWAEICTCNPSRMPNKSLQTITR